MSIEKMDRLEIDTAIWIDANVAKCSDLGELRKEIEAYESSLTTLREREPQDFPAEAHTKVYLQKLREAQSKLIQEIKTRQGEAIMPSDSQTSEDQQ